MNKAILGGCFFGHKVVLHAPLLWKGLELGLPILLELAESWLSSSSLSAILPCNPLMTVLDAVVT